MHARQHPHERSDASDYDPLPGGVKDKRLIMVNGKPAMEYDGLVNAELAWILGRRFKNFGATGEPGTVGNNSLDELSETQRYAHQAYAGLGSGVDRMQRLASTAWIENMVKTALGTVRIDLHEIVLGTPYQGGMDSLIHDWSNFLFGTATMCADPLAQRLAADINARGGLPVQPDSSHIGHELSKLGDEKLSGVLFLEKGPFLRGFQVDTEAIDMSVFKGHEGHGRCSRNIGDACVMSAIELEIRRRNLMDWTPDGIILSKLESPTDEPHKSIEMDARSAQLFNVAVQGPAISTTPAVALAAATWLGGGAGSASNKPSRSRSAQPRDGDALGGKAGGGMPAWDAIAGTCGCDGSSKRPRRSCGDTLDGGCE